MRHCTNVLCSLKTVSHSGADDSVGAWNGYVEPHFLSLPGSVCKRETVWWRGHANGYLCKGKFAILAKGKFLILAILYYKVRCLCVRPFMWSSVSWKAHKLRNVATLIFIRKVNIFFTSYILSFASYEHFNKRSEVFTLRIRIQFTVAIIHVMSR